MRKNISRILFVVGLIIFLFPFVLRIISYFNQTTAIYNYKSEISNSSKAEIENRIATSEEYNKKIADESPTVSIGDELNSNNVESNSVFDFLKTGNVIGTLIIPKINVNLPLYDGLSNDNLQKGVVHLSDTSYPTGQTSTHSVIAGHSGLTRAKILDDLDKLEVGDTFQIEYLNQLSNYEVISIKIVLPEETESLRIQKNETLVTLVTCTPKSINTHRLLVTAKKVDFPEQKELTKKEKIISFLKKYYIYMVIFAFVVTAIIVAIVVRNKKLKSKNKVENKVKIVNKNKEE